MFSQSMAYDDRRLPQHGIRDVIIHQSVQFKALLLQGSFGDNDVVFSQSTVFYDRRLLLLEGSLGQTLSQSPLR